MYVSLIPTTFDSNYVRAKLYCKYVLHCFQTKERMCFVVVLCLVHSSALQALSTFLLLEKKKRGRREMFETLHFIVSMSRPILCVCLLKISHQINKLLCQTVVFILLTCFNINLLLVFSVPSLLALTAANLEHIHL